MVGDLRQGFDNKGENLNIKKILKFKGMYVFLEEMVLNREEYNVRD